MSQTDSPELILASTSPYRKALLERLGVPFRCVAPDFDESAVSSEGVDPRTLAETLALGKARSVLTREPLAVVIGSDQLVSISGRIFGKPGGRVQAVAQLQALSGQTHELITAMVVLRRDDRYAHTDLTRLHMRALGKSQIERYVQRDTPLDCAGSYKLEERGIALFDQIETEDFTAITGLPLLALNRILERLGYEFP